MEIQYHTYQTVLQDEIVFIILWTYLNWISTQKNPINWTAGSIIDKMLLKFFLVFLKVGHVFHILDLFCCFYCYCLIVVIIAAVVYLLLLLLLLFGRCCSIVSILCCHSSSSAVWHCHIRGAAVGPEILYIWLLHLLFPFGICHTY